MSFPAVPIGAIFTVKNGATPASGEGGYWDGDIPWVTPADLGGLAHRFISSGARNITVDGYESCGTQMVPVGSIILSIRAPIGHMAISQQAMCFNQGCRGLVPSSRIRTDFAYWALVAAKPELEAAGQGTTFIELGRSKLRTVKIPLPDLATQKAIAAFLNRETARIDKLIAKKEQQVELLLQKSVSQLDDLTFEAPTATPDQLVPFKWICKISNGQVDPTEPDWADFSLIAPNHIEQRTGRLLYTETAREQGADSGKYAFPADTVVYSKIRPNLAKACIVPHEGLCSADMYPIIPAARLRPKFLLMQLLSRKFTDWATTESMRVAMPKINRETIGMFRLLVPPIEIQDQAIETWLAAKESIETSREAIVQSLSLLREHRTALITAAVTGQIDIRENLPTAISTSDRDRFRLIVGAEIIHRLPDNPKRARVKVHKITYLAETHLSIDALQGNYLREAAGPLDRALREETERSLEAAGYYRANQTDGTGTAVTYTPLAKAGQHKAELATLLGSKAEALRSLIAMLADLDRRATEAVATLYAVWNDALMDGATPDDAAIVNGVLTEWHREKCEKFNAADLNTWLSWMKRHNLIPHGQGPKTKSTMTPRLL